MEIRFRNSIFKVSSFPRLSEGTKNRINLITSHEYAAPSHKIKKRKKPLKPIFLFLFFPFIRQQSILLINQVPN